MTRITKVAGAVFIVKGGGGLGPIRLESRSEPSVEVVYHEEFSDHDGRDEEVHRTGNPGPCQAGIFCQMEEEMLVFGKKCTICIRGRYRSVCQSFSIML